jgi:hypothetical protein
MACPSRVCALFLQCLRVNFRHTTAGCDIGMSWFSIVDGTYKYTVFGTGTMLSLYHGFCHTVFGTGTMLSIPWILLPTRTHHPMILGLRRL